MRIFDSLKNNKWSGKGIDIKPSSIIILKSAKFDHAINIRSGKYTIKIVGKKRTGSGKINIEISSDQNEIFLKEELNFNNSTWSEYSLSFEVNRKIKFYRDRNVYGSVEMGRVYIDLLSDSVVKELPSKSRRRVSLKVKTGRAKPVSKSQSIDTEIISGNKKIAFIVPYHIYGGAEIYIQNIINKLTNQDISILYMKRNNLKNNITNKEVFHRDVKSTSQLRGIIKSSEYDYIVYYNRLDIYSLLLRMKVNDEISGKLVEIYHSDFIWVGSLSSVKERRFVDKIITVSRSLSKDISGVKESNRDVIPVGINLDKFSSRNNDKLKESLGIDLYKPVIGVVARLSKEKRIGYIISLAFEMPDYEFVIVGDGPEKISISKEINRLKLTNVKMLGYKKDVSGIYNIFDGFVLASKIEGTPISIIESMASGVPVFSNMVGAIPDMLEDGITGFRITEDPCLDRLIIEDNISNLEVIESARRYVEKNHDIDRVHLEFMNSLLSIDGFYKKSSNEKSFLLRGEYI